MLGGAEPASEFLAQPLSIQAARDEAALEELARQAPFELVFQHVRAAAHQRDDLLRAGSAAEELVLALRLITDLDEHPGHELPVPLHQNVGEPVPVTGRWRHVANCLCRGQSALRMGDRPDQIFDGSILCPDARSRQGRSDSVLPGPAQLYEAAQATSCRGRIRSDRTPDDPCSASPGRPRPWPSYRSQ